MRLEGKIRDGTRHVRWTSIVSLSCFGIACAHPAPPATATSEQSSAEMSVSNADSVMPTLESKVGTDACAAQMDKCREVLVPNELQSIASRQSETAFRDFMCGTWFTSHQSSVEGEGGINVLVLSAGGSGSSRSSEVSRTAYCADKSLKATESSQSSLYYRFTTEDARREWGLCIERVTQNCATSTSSSPIKMHIESMGDTAFVSLRWDRNYSLVQPRFSSTVASVNLVCPNPPKSGTPIPGGASGLTLQCSWRSGVAEAGALGIRTSVGDMIVKANRTIPSRGLVTYVVPVPAENKVETRSTCGPERPTPPLHEIRCGAHPMCECIGDRRWCFLGTVIEVTSPGPEWRLESVLTPPDCVRNLPSCEWNQLGAPDRYRVLEQTNQRVVARVLSSSGSMGIRQCATWARYAMGTREDERGRYQVKNGTTFEIEVPDGSLAFLRGRIDGQDFVLPTGKEDSNLKVHSRMKKPSSELIVYRLASR